ncbi:Hpt domain-containing protein [Falsihalocynthiibacter sp. SS001]|uniref:Hpt domain-containing protein n=1 Tax=Falsihalocynthiibacter sp. SS001 TaxID=3349698 RepID=UPI0036D22347
MNVSNDATGRYDYPLVDYDILNQMLEVLGREKVEELFTKFIDEAAASVAQFSKLYEVDEINAILPEVHRISGSASTFGAYHLHKILFAAERAGLAGNHKEFRQYLPHLPAILDASKVTLLSSIRAE